jgi:hypothetical protein
MSKRKKVYLLRERGSDDFKIGISIDIVNRAKTLSQEIDLDRSFYIDHPDSLSAREMEVMLHSLFQDYRIREKQGNGSTEWFTDCYAEIERFLHEHPQLKASLKPLHNLELFEPRVYSFSEEDWRHAQAVLSFVLSMTLEEFDLLQTLRFKRQSGQEVYASQESGPARVRWFAKKQKAMEKARKAARARWAKYRAR